MPAVAGGPASRSARCTATSRRKDDLQRTAVGLARATVARLAMAGAALDRSNVHGLPPPSVEDLAAELAAVRVQHTTPDGRSDARDAGWTSRASVERGAAGGDHGPGAAEVVDLAVAVTSSSMFLELVDRMGHDPEQAADLVADLLEMMIATEAGRAAGEEKG